ncbi:GyrI-like domain-containing protein [Ruminococcaceae bacterium OttesenSCG-928-L11]|nr:GyrI-like domain-containing protein [Ruminococcaceae bacterium OttesenSCG-928-L11]
MEIQAVQKEAFSVIGKEGSTEQGAGFVKQLWDSANANFADVQTLAKRDTAGNLVGLWGLMSDMGRQFRPWEEGFTKGLYLAGIEVDDDAEAPDGWAKWTAPASEYLRAKIVGDPSRGFGEVIQYIKDNGKELAGAVYDFNHPGENGQLYMYFPIRRL